MAPFGKKPKHDPTFEEELDEEQSGSPDSRRLPAHLRLTSPPPGGGDPPQVRDLDELIAEVMAPGDAVPPRRSPESVVRRELAELEYRMQIFRADVAAPDQSDPAPLDFDAINRVTDLTDLWNIWDGSAPAPKEPPARGIS